MSATRRMAVGVARAWTHLYTSRMPTELRVSRREEIDSDLWEHVRDGRETGTRPLITALEILSRTCLGVVDDLTWRFEAAWQERAVSHSAWRLHMDTSARRTRWVSIFAVATGATVILLIGLVPTLKVYFESVGIPLPLPTRLVMGLSTIVMAYWWATLVVGVALLLGLTRLTRVSVLHDGGVDRAREVALTKFEPIVIVGLSVVVGAMVLAMFLPIFDVVSAMR